MILQVAKFFHHRYEPIRDAACDYTLTLPAIKIHVTAHYCHIGYWCHGNCTIVMTMVTTMHM